ncbi:sulfatase-like hydrolase/transferase [Halovulum sp. GXIMD14794]
MTQKNIILFLTDQWRWDTLNRPGNPAKLPNLRAFAGESANFVNACTSVPLCTPARGSLYTGKWPHQTGTMDNVQGSSFYPHGKLHPGQRTYMERLQEQGYDVTFIGKWHLGAGTLIERGITDAPLSDGGEQALVTGEGGLRFDGPRLDPYYGTIAEGVPIDGQRVAVGIERLREYAKSDKPFCLIVSLQGPHFPHHVPEKWVRLYDDLPEDFMPENHMPQFSESGKPAAQGASYWPCQSTGHLTQADWRRTAQHYWGFCSYIDDLFGQLRREVSALGLDESSVMAFTADHGEMLGAHGWFDKGPFFYDEVLRIPMLVRDQGAAPGPREGFTSFRDLFPTLIERAGVPGVLTEAEARRSYWAEARDHVCFGYDAYQGRQFKFRGIRTAQHKYVWSPHDIEELYDLEVDPQERVNLAESARHRSVKAGLRRQVFDWMRSEGDALALGGHHPPVGSYIDGRDASEQHDHGWKRSA